MRPEVQPELGGGHGVELDFDLFRVDLVGEALRALVRDIFPVAAGPVLDIDLAGVVPRTGDVPYLHGGDDVVSRLKGVPELQRSSLVVRSMALPMPRTIPVPGGGAIESLTQSSLVPAISVLRPNGVTVCQVHHIAAAA